MKSLEEFLDDDPQYREQIVEYKFLSDLTQHLASRGRKLEILRVHTDSFGYDLVLKVDDNTKYVQLKSVKMGGRAASWDVHKSLLQNEDGVFVLVIVYFVEQGMMLKYRVLNEDEKTSILEKKPKRKSDPDKYCRITKGHLHGEESIDGLAFRLFLPIEHANG